MSIERVHPNTEQQEAKTLALKIISYGYDNDTENRLKTKTDFDPSNQEFNALISENKNNDKLLEELESLKSKHGDKRYDFVEFIDLVLSKMRGISNSRSRDRLLTGPDDSSYNESNGSL